MPTTLMRLLPLASSCTMSSWYVKHLVDVSFLFFLRGVWKDRKKKIGKRTDETKLDKRKGQPPKKPSLKFPTRFHKKRRIYGASLRSTELDPQDKIVSIERYDYSIFFRSCDGFFCCLVSTSFESRLAVIFTSRTMGVLEAIMLW